MLDGWLRQLTATGLYLIPPDGTRDAWISIEQRVSPLRPFGEAARAALGLLPSELRDATGWDSIRSSVSAAGQPMTIATISRRLATGQVFASSVAAIVTEHYYVWLHGAGHGAFATQIATIVDALAMNMYVGVPAIRPRFYRYAPPLGWRGLRRRLHTLWIPRDPEPQPAFIHVLDAVPHRDPITVDLFGCDPLSTARPATCTPTALDARLDAVHAATTWARDGRAIVDLHLHDATFAYVLRLHAPAQLAAELVPTLYAIARSIEPVARPTTERAAVAYEDLWPT
jgi:hypothetical protein